MSEEPPDDSTDREPASDLDDHDDLEDPFAELADAESDAGIEDPFEELDAPGAGGAADRGDVDPPDPDRDRSGEGAAAAPAGEDPLAELDVPDAPPEEDVFDGDVFDEDVFDEDVFDEDVFDEDVFDEDVFEEDVFDEDVFEEMETADLDEEAVWEAVFEESGGDTGPETETEEGADAVVRKEQYCKKCEHFSEPPELACNNPGTDIVEVVGVDEFRVRNCPVVADRRRADTVFPDEG